MQRLVNSLSTPDTHAPVADRVLVAKVSQGRYWRKDLIGGRKTNYLTVLRCDSPDFLKSAIMEMWSYNEDVA